MTRIGSKLLGFKQGQEIEMQRPTRTYFEQIPVAAVKKLVDEFLPPEKEMIDDQARGVETREKATAALQLPAHLHCRKRTLP